MTFSGRSAGAAAPPSRMRSNIAGSIRRNIVGTSETWVAPELTLAITSASLNVGRMLMGLPNKIDRARTLNPATCETGRHNSQCVDESVFSRACDMLSSARIESCVCTTPFGVPVDPLVAIISASLLLVGSKLLRLTVFPDSSITSDGLNCAINESFAAWGSRWSMGNTASPASHALRTWMTNSVLAGISSAMRRFTIISVGA